MKQTAVEWYIENVKLIEIEYLYDKITTTQLDVMIDNLVEQAKEMEKQQIKDAWDASDTNMRNQFSSSAYKAITFNQWFEKFENK